ncbi:hypothetical protein GALL_521700 [mine drainage metagenome]|uniref:Uncharacterized protein n=1 Tax=mine drainage metagenome TaxID=410659 RepID=A0A1J5PEM6_9ZZZZ
MRCRPGEPALGQHEGKNGQHAPDHLRRQGGHRRQPERTLAQLPRIDRPQEHGDQHDEIAWRQAHLRQMRHIALGHHQRNSGDRQHRADPLRGAHRLAVERPADEQDEHRRAGGNERHVERRARLQRHILQRVVAAHPQNAHHRQRLPVAQQHVAVAPQIGPDDQQGDEQCEQPAVKTQGQWRNLANHQPPDHRIARPEQRRQSQQEGGTRVEGMVVFRHGRIISVRGVLHSALDLCAVRAMIAQLQNPSYRPCVWPSFQTSTATCPRLTRCWPISPAAVPT